MRVPYYQINAFSNRLFGGNPAGVCVLDKWLPDGLLQSIAAENNLAETAFFLRNAKDDVFKLRWFTPTIEMDLCGHATLATAFVMFTELGFKGDHINFDTRSGILSAVRKDGLVELDFPSRPAKPCAIPQDLERGLGKTPREVLKARDYLAVFDSQDDVATLKPDLKQLSRLDCLGIIATAKGNDADFVSRFFAPRAGIPEDPVTGSSHSTLIPYWAKRLDKTEMFARQISPRGGELYVRNLGERVAIGGAATVYFSGELEVAQL